MQWSDPRVLIASLLTACLFSALCAVWARGHAHRHGLVDQPGERRSHALPTPRGGGIGIAATALIACLWLGYSLHVGWYLVASGLAAVSMVGWFDDHRPLPAWPRLVTHLAAAGCVAAGMWMQGAGPPVIAAALLGVPVMVNAWNFMDGIDGMATLQAVLCAAGFGLLLDGPAQWLAVVVASACLGFLPLNFPKARVFLGDVGSGAAGYLVAVLALMSAESGSDGIRAIAVLPLTVFIVDTSLTLLGRIMRREQWWRPHVQHLYQRMSRQHGHVRVTVAYAGWTATSIAVMLVLYHATWTAAAVGAFAVVAAAMLSWCLLGRRYPRTEGIGT